LKLGTLVVMSITALFVEIEGFIKDKLNYHFQYENVIYPIIGVVLVVLIMKKINPSVLNEKINGIISTCVLFFIIIIVPFLLY